MLRVREVLQLPAMVDVRPLSDRGFDRQVRWVHMWPEVLPWPHGGELLLTTGYSWPADAAHQRRILRDLNDAGVAAILFRARGPFFPPVPAAIPGEAELLDLAILEARAEISFADLMETLNREIIRSQFETIERSEQIHRTLTEAALEAQAVDDIATRLSQLIQKPAYVLDRRLHPLPTAPHGWDGVEHALRRARYLVAQVKERGHVRFEVGGASEALLFAIPVAGEITGHLLIVSEDTGFSDLDIRAGEHAAVVVGLHLLRQQAVAEAEVRVRNTFVEAVLQGKLGDDSTLRERAQLLGFDPDATYTATVTTLLDSQGNARTRALTSPDDFRLRSRLGQAVQSALEILDLPVFMAYSLNRVIVLLPTKIQDQPFRRRVQDLWARTSQLAEFPVAAALGRPRRAIDMPASLREAEVALEMAHGAGLWWYDDLVVVRVLASATDREALRAMWEEMLHPLRSTSGSSALYETARMLVATGFRQREAARALGVHWNTLRYRITRLEQIWGRRVDEPELRLRLHLAFEVERIVPPTQWTAS